MLQRARGQSEAHGAFCVQPGQQSVHDAGGKGIATADAINDAGQRPRRSLREGSIASQQQRTEYVMVGADYLAVSEELPALSLIWRDAYLR